MLKLKDRKRSLSGKSDHEFGLHENTTNRWRSGLSANGHLLYVRCSIHTAERQWQRICVRNNTNLADMLPGTKLVHGKSRHSQSQGSVDRSNQEVRDMLLAWLSDNNTKTWSEGLRFIQSKKNLALHSGIKTSPYEAVWNGAEDQTWGFSAHWRHVLFHRNWRRTGTAL